jgi:hypothetical protein
MVLRAELFVFVAFVPNLALCMTNLEKGVIRRESRSERQVQLDQEGYMQVLPGEENNVLDKPQKELVGFENSGRAAHVAPCDIQYIQMPEEGKDECLGSPGTHEIKDSLECQNAAEALGLAKGSPAEINNYHATATGGILNVVHKCFLNSSSQTVQYNPTEPNATQAMVGTKICWRTKYHEVKPQIGAMGDLCAAVPQSDAITDFTECWAASKCVSAMPCEHVPFNVSDVTKPAGCWRNGIGCWSFNFKTIDEVGFSEDTNLTQVCKNQDTVS